MQIQENPPGDNQNSSSEKLDSSQEVSNNSEPIYETHSETPRRSKPRK